MGYRTDTGEDVRTPDFRITGGATGGPSKSDKFKNICGTQSKKNLQENFQNKL